MDVQVVNVTGAGSPPAPPAVFLASAISLKKRPWWKRCLNKGDLSNAFTFTVMFIGILLEILAFDQRTRRYNFVLAFGLFGFAGGITNWLAVKMLFDKVPGLYGSGVIPNQFDAIRTALKDAIMESFFEETFLRGYMKTMGPQLVGKMDLGQKLSTFVQKPEFDSMFVLQLEQLSATPQGAMLGMIKPFIGGSFTNFIPMVKPLLISMAQSIGEQAGDADMGELIDVGDFRTEVERMMAERMLMLTPEVVKEMMEDVIREHLGWLVVWGNVFGGLIGVVAQAIAGSTCGDPDLT